MRKFVLAAVAVVALSTPATAFYTQCTVTKETELSIRPGGPSEPRYQPVNKGDKVAFRNSYRGWWFVMHASGECTEGSGDCTVNYGWLPRNVLTDCHEMEGTP